MATPAPLLTSEIPADVTGWWASEKFDGVRAIWTGSKLLSRNGNDLGAPKSFTKGLPKGVRLDGELWAGWGGFDRLQSVLQTKGSSWGGIDYLIFDLADIGTFEERQEKLDGIKLPNRAFSITHYKLRGHDDLDRFERDVVDHGGEGVVIRRPGSKYRPGRVGDVIKCKRLTKDVDRWQG